MVDTFLNQLHWGHFYRGGSKLAALYRGSNFKVDLKTILMYSPSH